LGRPIRRLSPPIRIAARTVGRDISAILPAIPTTTSTEWIPYGEFARGRAHTVRGEVRVLPEVEGPVPGRRRHLLVYLPPSYEQGVAAGRRYPVLYAQDGQNLFDEATSYAGEWRCDETMERLAAERGIEAIVVGIPNAGTERLHEYSPFPEPGLSDGQADAYLRFLLRRVRPLIEAEFAVTRDREATGILGSSLGGLFSLYAFFERPDVFGLVAAFSPSLQLGGDAMLAYLKAQPPAPGRVYIDVGAHEGARPRVGRFLFRPFARVYPARVRAAFRILARKGYRPGRDLVFVQDRGGRHNEVDWGRRLPGALEFLLEART
jgi:predicted alpha/beta superfamily hydrolase